MSEQTADRLRALVEKWDRQERRMLYVARMDHTEDDKVPVLRAYAQGVKECRDELTTLLAEAGG